MRTFLFQVHFWVGALIGAYVFVMSVSGSMIVYRGKLFEMGLSVERIVDLHENLLTGSTGRAANGIGAICLTLLCLTGAAIWWPAITHWRRSLAVEWRASFARINWDQHSAAGFWCFPFVLIWAVSGIYLVFQDQFVVSVFLDHAGRVASWLTQLHFGRFNWFIEAVWTLLGLIPAVLAFTGVFICCRRVIFKKPIESQPNRKLIHCLSLATIPPRRRNPGRRRSE